jgi:hypothetical protein
MRKPWDEIPGDDGYQWSLNVTRMVCTGWLLFPLLFLAMNVAVMSRPGEGHEEPLIVALFAALAVIIVPAAPFVRERLVRVGIDIHLEGRPEMRRHRAVYSTFATASITAFLIGQAPALFGFISGVLTKSLVPLAVGSVFSYLTWWMLWPREALWVKWAWQAKIGREDEAPAALDPSATLAPVIGSAEPAEPAPGSPDSEEIAS